MNSADRPVLRGPLDIQLLERRGEKFVVISDPRGVCRGPVVLPLPLWPIATRFDGARTLGEIAAEGEPYGITISLVQRLAAELDELMLLDSAASRAAWQQIQDNFRLQPVREMAMSDRAYPRSGEDLRRMIAQFVERAELSPLDLAPDREVVALLSPHIDYQRGWQTYCSVWSVLECVDRPDVIVLVGTAHQGGSSIFHLTAKGFDTPFGCMPAAKDSIERLVSRCGKEILFRDEILHKHEHSLELQLPWIGCRFVDQGLPAIVPILVGSFHHFVARRTQPMLSQEVALFVEALAAEIEHLRNEGKRVFLYGAVDLAHMGLHFGDTQRVSENHLDVLEAQDRAMLDCVLQGTAEDLFNFIAAEGDRRRICGFPAIYLMMAVTRAAGLNVERHLLDYRQAVERQSDCVVTFASSYWCCPKRV